MFFSIRPGGKNRTKIIFGENSPRYAYTGIPISTHAEIDTLQKIKNEFSQKKKILKGDLLVVKLSKTGLLSNASPCYHCLKQLSEARYVNIKNIYYSDSTGKIICQKLDVLVNSPNQFISSGYRHRMKLPRVDEQCECC